MAHERLSVNLILVVDGAAGSSSIADTGGLVANGEGTATGKPKAGFEGPRLNPRLGILIAGGLVAEPEGTSDAGAVPLLNSAHRGHLRFVFI